MTTLKQLRAKAEAAQQEFERGLAQLFRDVQRRRKLYSDDEHQERERALRQERARKLDQVIHEIRQCAAEAEQEIALLEDGDPTTLLSAEELAEAAAKKPFIEDDFSSMSNDQLVGKLRAVLQSGDRVSQFVYWRAAAVRSAAVDSQDLSKILDELHKVLIGPSRLARAERARQTIEEASEVELFAGNLKSGARSSAGSWVNRRMRSA